ncbi:hypothetical protein CEUSTIGMA_g6632.t1 [Chlamydomonas eustigma]|uniref:Uncharacterized protein n=1 Tax=Chlamydomonas eustigma TaxID=1157962 RepID=A0A250X8H6_9CHLO|nr:hypothetical protein CEUSTIGMA_g6632.t1 [Chlamydomonas eustigma]|eukprot:GAX79192.1 hypothetical protein CEUSTIGMA_g6632.t1 [Chlamydomonas eustigma]
MKSEDTESFRRAAKKLTSISSKSASFGATDCELSLIFAPEVPFDPFNTLNQQQSRNSPTGTGSSVHPHEEQQCSYGDTEHQYASLPLFIESLHLEEGFSNLAARVPYRPPFDPLGVTCAASPRQVASDMEDEHGTLPSTSLCSTTIFRKPPLPPRPPDSMSNTMMPAPISKTIPIAADDVNISNKDSITTTSRACIQGESSGIIPIEPSQDTCSGPESSSREPLSVFAFPPSAALPTLPHSHSRSRSDVDQLTDNGMQRLRRLEELGGPSSWRRGTRSGDGKPQPQPAQHQQHGAEDGGRIDDSVVSGSDTSQQQPRELLIYAVPLIKDKLVFLPVSAWKMGPEQQDHEEEAPAPSIGGAVKASLGWFQGTMSNIWKSMKEKDPDTLQNKMYVAGNKILENMTAEERLMRNIPSSATKLVVYHPASVMPIEVQEQLSSMTATFCLKSVGKAAVAGLVLPVAVGMEILAVPGAGWYALYQLYKNSVTAAGGQRLKSYLSRGADIRVNYAADVRLDTYMERSQLSPDGALTSDDIDELCHDLQEPSLNHPLTELRKRYLCKHVPQNSDYALLPLKPNEDNLSAVSGSHPLAED